MSALVRGRRSPRLQSPFQFTTLTLAAPSVGGTPSSLHKLLHTTPTERDGRAETFPLLPHGPQSRTAHGGLGTRLYRLGCRATCAGPRTDSPAYAYCAQPWWADRTSPPTLRGCSDGMPQRANVRPRLVALQLGRHALPIAGRPSAASHTRARHRRASRAACPRGVGSTAGGGRGGDPPARGILLRRNRRGARCPAP